MQSPRTVADRLSSRSLKNENAPVFNAHLCYVSTCLSHSRTRTLLRDRQRNLDVRLELGTMERTKVKNSVTLKAAAGFAVGAAIMGAAAWWFQSGKVQSTSSKVWTWGILS